MNQCASKGLSLWRSAWIYQMSFGLILIFKPIKFNSIGTKSATLLSG